MRIDELRRLAAAVRGQRNVIVTPRAIETWDTTGRMPVVTTEPNEPTVQGLQVETFWIDEAADFPQQRND